MGVRRRRSGGTGRSPPGRRPCPGALGLYRSPTHAAIRDTLTFIPCIVTPQRALLAFWGRGVLVFVVVNALSHQSVRPFGLRALRPAREPTSRRRVRARFQTRTTRALVPPCWRDPKAERIGHRYCMRHILHI